MERLVDDLLLLAQADRGLQLEWERVELDDLLLSVYRETKAMATGQEVLLGQVDAITIQGDRRRLQQLFLNLAQNAIRYTPANGQVIFSWRKEDSNALISVQDTGIGIAPEDLPHIFERFYRADKARPRSGGGTGLGLAIVKWIVESHGGKISVESSPGVGTTFTVHLPPHPPKE